MAYGRLPFLTKIFTNPTVVRWMAAYWATQPTTPLKRKPLGLSQTAGGLYGLHVGDFSFMFPRWVRTIRSNNAKRRLGLPLVDKPSTVNPEALINQRLRERVAESIK